MPNFLVKNKFSALPKNFKITKRDYSKYGENGFLHHIQSINWESELSGINEVNDIYESSFYSKLSNIVDKHMTLKDIKQLSETWITTGIKKSLKIKINTLKSILRESPNMITKNINCI